MDFIFDLFKFVVELFGENGKEVVKNFIIENAENGMLLNIIIGIILIIGIINLSFFIRGIRNDRVDRKLKKIELKKAELELQLLKETQEERIEFEKIKLNNDIHEEKERLKKFNDSNIIIITEINNKKKIET